MTALTDRARLAESAHHVEELYFLGYTFKEALALVQAGHYQKAKTTTPRRFR